MLTLAGLKTTARVFGTRRMVDFSMQTNAIEEKTPEEILAEYRENIAKVDAYAVAVRNLNITIYSTETPDWYTDEFKKQYVECKNFSQTWLNDIMGRLGSVPKSIIDYDSAYKMYAKRIKKNCELLLKEFDEDVQKTLIKNLEDLKEDVGDTKTVVSDLINSIDNYISRLQGDETFFADIFQKACKTKEVNEGQLEEFRKRKEELEKEIKKIEKIILGTGIAGGVALAAAPIGIACGPIGIIIGIIVGVAALALLITTIVESAICEQKRAELTICANQMDDMTKTVQSLEGFCNGLNAVIAAVTTAKSSAQQILNCWQELEDEVGRIIKGLESDEEEAKKKSYKKIIDEMNATDAEWNEIVEKAKLYAQINVEVKKEVIEISKSA
ncbi:MAG: HBL/NHE enterotoxin family protein [Lachnospiraceae bacterium]|nr:HBL/NHE enterotoxin family protein [Lachnospiraceae bacterium]